MAPSYNPPNVRLLGDDAPHCPSSLVANSIPTTKPKSSLSTTPPNSLATSLSSFPLFTLLPPELRLKIWTLTLAEPRLVALNYQSSTAPITPSTPKSHRGCTSPASIPITLQINHESRTLALQHYSLSFGLPGGITFPGSRPSTLPCKVFFSAARGDVLFFGLPKQARQEGLVPFVQACTMVHPGSSGFGQVRRLAVQKALFERKGKGVCEMQLRLFWERVKGKFLGVEEMVFVEGREEALSAFEGMEERDREAELDVGRREGWRNRMDGVCYADDGLGVSCWVEERFEDKVERVVRSLEAECGWVAPRWRAVRPREDSLDTRMEGMVIDTLTRSEKEEMLVRQMRGLFGHENVSNAL